MPSFDSPYLIGLFTHRSPLMIAVLASSSANQNDGNCSKNGMRIRQYHRRRWSYDKMDTASRFPALNRSSYPLEKHSDLGSRLIIAKSKQSVIAEMGHESINIFAASGVMVKWKPPLDSSHQIGLSTLKDIILILVSGLLSANQNNL